MELKSYQQDALNNLDEYLRRVRKAGYAAAFNQFWEEQLGPYNPLEGKGMEPYRDDLPGVPHVCIKVPTAGGKTFIAANAIDVVYRYYRHDMAKAVVWLVPSVTILEQTLKNLSDPAHPYRQRINTHFNSRVEVFGKEDLLQGSSFNPVTVREQLNILVLSFDSLRSRKKEDRKFYQENGQLAPFVLNDGDDEHMLPGTEESALINIIRKLKPLVIVDEAHGAVSELSVEMLKNLNPSFVLDLTATPRANSNIISFVDALALRKENMVKLPVIVYNHNDRNAVIENAINLRARLEEDAKEEEKNGGAYIRPIVLFQAQTKTAENNVTFEKIRKVLLDLQIPAEQIRIKTAEINELKNTDLLSRDCPVRFIITVNALKEGWDCPFAYVLASLADRTSSIDVEQILGRILRQPYVRKHDKLLLNCSFVLTSSGKIIDVLDRIVQGLNKAGFSSHDYKLANELPVEAIVKQEAVQEQLQLTESEPEFSVNTDAIHIGEEHAESPALKTVETQAIAAVEQMERLVEERASSGEVLSFEIESKVTYYEMKEAFAETAKSISLPQFFLKVPPSPLLFGDEEQFVFLSKENLLQDFRLSQKGHDIHFEMIDPELFAVDLEQTTGDDFTPTFNRLPRKDQDPIVSYIVAQPRENQVKLLTGRLVSLIDIRSIADKEIAAYVKKIVADFTPQQFTDVLYHIHSYADKIRDKINVLAAVYAEERFRMDIAAEQIVARPNYHLPERIRPTRLAPAIGKSLYRSEAAMNPFESEMIAAIANCPNVLFWHRNPSNGFYINGYTKHYPDFIVCTESRRIIVIETKGDFLDGKNTMSKITLGSQWEKQAGPQYKYFMVFEEKEVPGAYTLPGMLDIIGKL